MTRRLVAVAVLLAACGTDSVSLEDYPQEFRDAFCRNFVKCGVVKDLDTCRNLNFGVDLHITASGQAAFDMGKAKFHGEKAQSCVDGIANSSCDLTSESQRQLPLACDQVATGTLHNGEACTLSAECISTTCSVPNCGMACCTGSCVGDTPPAVGKLGGPCPSGRCESGAYCDFASEACLSYKQAGAVCAAAFECAPGLACIGTGLTGTCTKLPKLGEACTTFCTDFGATCNPTSKTCVEVAVGGEACATDNDCSALYFCDRGACSGGVALGAACTPQDHCVDPRAFCDVPRGAISGTCILPKANGMPCNFNDECQSFACSRDTGMCIDEPVCI
ncbi:MAG TPA: Dickkopf N-terminal cysteine-rich domain-containing protein [Kofleriaceae bacterium]